MNKLNQIILEGNVVRPPLFKETPRGTKVCTMPIAVDRLYKDKNGNRIKEVGFYDIEAWGENFTASIARHGVKGRGVRVVGRIKQSRWKTSDGRNMTKTFVVAEHVEFRPVFDHGALQASHEASADADAADVTAIEPASSAVAAAYQAEINNLEQAAEGIREEQYAESGEEEGYVF